MADIPIPPIPPRRAPLIDIMRELEARPRARQSQEFDPVAAMVAERRSQSRQPLPLPPTPPAAAPPPQTGDSAEAGTPRDLSSVSPTIRSRLPENNPYVAAAIDIAEKYNLPRDVFLSLVHQESKFDPKAKSPKGAFGLTQLMPGTARDLGVDPRDPMANLDAGARYLRQQIDRFGSLPLALAAYNSGPQRVIDAGRVIPNIRETQNYVSDILRNAGMEGTATDQRYGFAEGGLAALDEKYAEGGRVRRPAAAPVASPFDADYIERLAAQAVGAGEPVTEVRSSEGRGFAPMPRSFGEAGQRMSAVIRGDVEPTPEEERQMNVVRGFTEGPASIRAYHGSPYAFERFDISKIGTGEGNQVYGHGLYFADKEAVARTYFDDMVGRKIIGGSKPDFNNPEHWAASLLDMNEGSRAAAIKDAKIHYGMTSPELISETVKLLRSKKPLPPMESSPGHMYEVRLRTAPEEMVNWNAPLVQQPERAIPFLEDVLRAPRTGSARVLEREMKPIGEAVNLRTPEVAAQLREAGIPGLRYLDAGSRSGGRGTRNYVMFGDDLIDITRRYAEGGLAALDQKYAEVGEVTEIGQPFYQDDARYSFTNDPVIDFPANTMRPLNIKNLINLGAMRLTYPGNGVDGGLDVNDQENFSVVSMYNDSAGGPTTNWPTHSRQNEFADMLQNMQQQALYRGKYNQIVDSARRLGILDEDIFMPEQQGEFNGQRNNYAEGGLAALDEKYAEGGTVRVPKETTIAGQDHRLAYITDREAALLKARGGSGRMTDYGVRAYDEGPGGDPSDNANSNSEAATQDAAGGNAGQGAGPTGAGAGATGEPGPGPTGADTGGGETSVTAPETAPDPAPSVNPFGDFNSARGFGVIGGLASLGSGVPGLGTVAGMLGAAYDAARANEQLSMMGLPETVDRGTAALNAATMGLFGQSVTNQFGQALGFDALAEAPMSAFSGPARGGVGPTPDTSGGDSSPLSDIAIVTNTAPTTTQPATSTNVSSVPPPAFIDWGRLIQEANARNMSLGEYTSQIFGGMNMARGGAVDHMEKMLARYEEGGPVASVYNPDEINDLANQILEGAYV